jgi:hypothetical protein
MWEGIALRNFDLAFWFHQLLDWRIALALHWLAIVIQENQRWRFLAHAVEQFFRVCKIFLHLIHGLTLMNTTHA